MAEIFDRYILVIYCCGFSSRTISTIGNYYYSNNSSLTQLCVSVWKQHLIPVDANDAPPAENSDIITADTQHTPPRHPQSIHSQLQAISLSWVEWGQAKERERERKEK